jgi:hypothetical protein
MSEPTTVTPADTLSPGNSDAFKQFVWLYLNIIARAATSLGMPVSSESTLAHAADPDSLIVQYLEHWLNQAHPDWEGELQQVKQAIGEKALATKINLTGRTARAIDLMELVQAKGWNDDLIANGLVAILANNKSKYRVLIQSAQLDQPQHA